MDVDRYLTDGAVRAAAGCARCSWEPPYPDHPNDDECGGEGQCLDIAREQLRAALPGILAAHRADVLREAVGDLIPYVLHPGGRDVVLALRQLADEAVAE